MIHILFSYITNIKRQITLRRHFLGLSLSNKLGQKLGRTVNLYVFCDTCTFLRTNESTFHDVMNTDKRDKRQQFGNFSNLAVERCQVCFQYTFYLVLENK